MKFKSALLTQVSGSLGGMTGSHNSAGLYLRSRTIPVNPNTAAQQAARQAVQSLATRWGDVLTATQRTAWQTYADNVPVTDKLGDALTLSGQQMYIRSNTPRIRAGTTIIDAAPTEFNLGTYTTPVVTADASATTLSAAIEATDAWCDEDLSFLIMQQSDQMGPAINYFKGPFIFVGSLEGDSIAPPAGPLLVTSLFPLTAGNVVYSRFRVSRADGRLSSASIVRSVIVA